MSYKIGTPVSTLVAESIKSRQSILKGTGEGINPETRISYTSHNIPWVRLSSSVNLSSEKAREFNVEAGDVLARTNVLEGTNLSRRNEPGLAGYNNSLIQGIRPQPGIIGLNVTSHNRFGSLRTAKVTFTCWTVEQINIMEVLYMRPGYSVLLEFGHSVYLDNDNQVQFDIEGIDFFNLVSTSKEQIFEKISAQREAYNYHYDALFGFIKNFEWSLRPDGGYDCTVSIVSIGDVVESVKSSFVLSDNLSVDSKDSIKGLYNVTENLDVVPDPSTKTSKDTVTYLHYSLNLIREFVRQKALNAPEGPSLFTLADQDQVFSFILKDIHETYERVLLFKPKNEVTVGPSTESQEKHGYYYIKLGLLLQIINKALIAVNEDSDLLIKLETSPAIHQYRSFQTHLSVNPSVCMKQDGNVVKFFSPMVDFGNSLYEGANVNINELFINIDYILESYNSLSGDSSEVNLHQFISRVMRGVQSSLGNINAFELQYFEETGTFAIVDRNFIHKAEEDKPLVEIYGQNSFVKAVTLTSRLSPAISTMIAISAQANPESNGMNGTAFGQLNQGLLDRVLPQKKLPVSIKPEPEEGEVNTSLEVLENYFGQLYLKYNITAETSGMIQTYTEYLSKLFAASRNPSNSFVIPYELSLTFNGISNLKIGESFVINRELLPATYKQDVAFLITGIEQSVSKEGWNTVVKSQMFIDRPSQPSGTYLNKSITPKLSKKVGGFASYVIRDENAWSAYFISYVAQRAEPRFPISANHIGYANIVRSAGSRSRPYGFTVIDPQYVKVRPGDIVVKNRMKSTNKFSDTTWSGASHGDIVIETTPTSITIIGGNVNNTVKRATITASRGRLPNPNTGLPNSYFVVVRPFGPGAPAVAEKLVRLAIDEHTYINNRKESNPEIHPRLREYYLTVTSNIPEIDSDVLT